MSSSAPSWFNWVIWLIVIVIVIVVIIWLVKYVLFNIAIGPIAFVENPKELIDSLLIIRI